MSIDDGYSIKQRRFRDTRTGEVVTQFSILDIAYFEEVME